MRLVAEDLLLLLIEPTIGKPVVDKAHLDRGLAGAVLQELAVRGRVSPAGPGEAAPRGRLVVRGDGLAGDPLLDGVLARLAARRPLKPPAAVDQVMKGLRPQLLDRLAAAGLVREEHGAVLGVFPTTRWPAANPDVAAELRQGIGLALAGLREPTQREAGLVSLLWAVDAAHKVSDGDRFAVRRRAKQIGSQDWAADAVRKAVAAATSSTAVVLS